MIKLGMVAAAGANHGITFSAMFNGEIDLASGKPIKAADPKLADARIVKIWDPNPRDAKKLADTRSIELVDSIEDAGKGVDAVLIPDDCTQVHAQYADPFIKTGVPLFCDKPLSRSYATAKKIVQRVRKKKMLFQSGSSLRYANEILNIDHKALGTPVVAATFSPNELIFYGIHALELLLGVVPAPIESVQHMGTETRDVVVLNFASGALATLHCGEDAKGAFHLVVHGDKGRVVVSSLTDFYQNMLAGFVNMVKTGKPPLSLEETLHVIAVLDSAQKSVESKGKLVRVPGVRAGKLL